MLLIAIASGFEQLRKHNVVVMNKTLFYEVFCEIFCEIFVDFFSICVTLSLRKGGRVQVRP